MHRLLQRRLCLHDYKSQDDRAARKKFPVTMLQKLDEDNEFPRKIIFFDEATFKGR